MKWLCDSLAIAAFNKELRLIWRFINNDIWDTVIPCLLTFVTAWIYHSKPLSDFPLYFFYSAIYTLFYILTFCVSNQVSSIEEDRINKPDRPLPSGLITEKETRRRLLVYNILFLLVSIPLNLVLFAAAWMVITLMLCNWGCSNHWATKNLLCITLGTITLLAAEWSIVNEIDKNVWMYILVISVWAGVGLPLQDMRDQDGDKIMGRKTLPLAIGDHKARWVLSIYFFIISPVIYYCAVLTQIPLSEIFVNTAAIIILVGEFFWHWWVAIRLWLYKSPKDDDKTYHYFVYLFIATIPVICIL